MFEWFVNNLATIVILTVLVLVVAAIVFRMIKDHKRGKSSCGCGCANCPMSGECHRKTTEK